MVAEGSRIYLVGAHERHNFGDWLLSYVAERLLAADHEVRWLNPIGSVGIGMSPSSAPFTNLADAALSDTNVPCIHVGGETLTCSSASAVVMSLDPRVARLREPEIRTRSIIGSDRYLAYVTPPHETVCGRPISWGPRLFFGVGGRGLASMTTQHKAAVVDALKHAEWVSARDSMTASALRGLGIEANVHPDLVSLLPRVTAELSSPQDRGRTLLLQLSESIVRAQGAAVISALAPWANHYDQLRIAVAGVAPTHDRLRDTLELASRANALRPGWATPVLELDPISIVEEIRRAGLVVASSLHFRVIAMTFSVAAVSFGVDKAVAYAREWDTDAAGCLTPDGLDFQITSAREVSTNQRRARAEHLGQLTYEAWTRALEAIPR